MISAAYDPIRREIYGRYGLCFKKGEFLSGKRINPELMRKYNF